MAKKLNYNFKKIGRYSFIAGIILALVVGLIPSLTETDQGKQVVLGTLVVLGIIVGFLNVTDEETIGFLVAALVLIIASSTTALTLAGLHPNIAEILRNVIIFVSAAAIIVALKTVYALAQD